ncbi:MAG: cation diffusion facilitator family transporter [Thermodesulfobacteriota bacterium]
MAHNHAHDHDHCHGHGHAHAHGSTRLGVVLFITVSYMVVEIVGGLLFNSLALLADAGHMFSDVMAQGLAYAAIIIGRRAPTDRHTFGFKRTEILAALWNGLALWAIVGVIFYEAAHRMFNPNPVVGKGMLAVAGIGLLVNLVLAGLLFRERERSLNVRGVFVHVISDALGSVGAVSAALIIMFTGYYVADPIVSVFIGLLILYSSWGIIREAVHILMEGVPPGIDISAVESTMLEQEGVCCIHDLHVWTIGSDRAALSAHVVMGESGRNADEIVGSLNQVLKDKFDIDHTTIQVQSTHDVLYVGSGLVCRPGTACAIGNHNQTVS